ncbi:MAG: RNA polymerase sigma factor region1.1 domain-containing protein, partial [Bacteriovoracaceae bacterium]
MSVVVVFLNSREFSRLIMKGKDQSYLTPEEINDAIPANIVDPQSLDQIMEKIEEARIQLRSADQDDEDAEKSSTEIAEDPSALDEEAELRASTSDPVKLYLKKMGSVALLTREGEVKIAKEIEDGEKEIVLSCLKSKHALEEIVKLKTKILQAEDQNEFVKDLVRGLDDESTDKEITEVRDTIFLVVENVKSLLEEIVNEDGTLKKLTSEESKIMKLVADELVDLTFNRKVINSFTEPVKSYYLQFKELYEQQERIYKFLEVENDEEY